MSLDEVVRWWTVWGSLLTGGGSLVPTEELEVVDFRSAVALFVETSEDLEVGWTLLGFTVTIFHSRPPLNSTMWSLEQ